jgi:nucleotide-binding universal stress UspA family protein
MVDVAKVILVPHDGHMMSDTALRYAVDIAKGMDMKVRLVRIIPQLLDISDMSYWTTPAQRKRVKKAMEWKRKRAHEREYKKLEKQISRIRLKGVEATTLVKEGIDVADEITKIIKKERPYIVVVGSRKLKSKGLSRIRILGSVARKLSFESPRPLLIVK